MKTNGVPAIIMLAAGFIDCVIAILTHMSLWNFTRQLLLVLVLFYVIGCVVKMIIDRNFKDMEDDQNGEETEESKEEQEAESSEEQENTEQCQHKPGERGTCGADGSQRFWKDDLLQDTGWL